MKKILLFSGIGVAGFGLYRYFKYQIDLALNYDYKIKNFEILNYNNDKINVSIEIEIKNNSSFEILIKEYDLKISFKGNNFASAVTKTPFVVLPNSSFILKTIGDINVKETKISVIPFVRDVFAKKPINIEVLGFIKANFLGLNHTLNFDNEQFEYSSDLLKEVGLSKQVNKFKIKNPTLSKLLGIK